ncbi:MAG: CsgG/HfaB family protein [Gemmatimonadaceae bacterium]|nr:CsgG/HfaB family protein [Gemmatimonadaceae bacterium]
MKRFARTAWALVLAGAAFPPATAVAQEANRPVVAILGFDNNSIGKDASDYNGIGTAIAEMLITELAKNPNVVVVDRAHIREVLREQDLVRSGQVDPGTAVRLGKLLGAQYMITGGFMSDGRGDMVLTARSINVQTTAVANPQRVQAKTDDVLGMIAQLSAKVSNDMKLPALDHGTGTRDGGAKPAKMDLRTAMLFAKGLDAEDTGDRARAAELFHQVLDKFPHYPPAEQHLARVIKSGN